MFGYIFAVYNRLQQSILVDCWQPNMCASWCGVSDPRVAAGAPANWLPHGQCHVGSSNR